MRAFQYLPILVLLLFGLSSLQAQQTPFLNYYTWNPRLFNPAAQGFNQDGEITAVYRSQFQNLEARRPPEHVSISCGFVALVQRPHWPGSAGYRRQGAHSQSLSI